MSFLPKLTELIRLWLLFIAMPLPTGVLDTQWCCKSGPISISLPLYNAAV